VVAAADAARPDSGVRQRLGVVRRRAEHLQVARLQPGLPAVVAVVSAEQAALLPYRLFLQMGFRSRLSATPDKE
jgi:hypothetical protein